jgi:pantetheine-phosphate adenylyltransferase
MAEHCKKKHRYHEKMSEKTALYPGTFDPLTSGHMSLIRRGCKVFDRIIVAVAENTPKKPLFSLEERVSLAREALRHEKKVTVEPFTGLTVEYAVKRGVCALLRGLRAVSDFEYEFQLALMNRRLQRHIETVFLMTDYQWLYISSTIIKSAASHGANIGGLVPENIRLALEEKYQNGKMRQGTPCLGMPFGGFQVEE